MIVVWDVIYGVQRRVKVIDGLKEIGTWAINLTDRLHLHHSILMRMN